jgi:hypothetical protein
MDSILWLRTNEGDAENETKVKAIERLLSINKGLRAWHILITKSCGKNISKQVIFN